MFYVAFAQQRNRSNLERKKQMILNKMRETQNALDQAASSKKQAEKKFSSIQSNIDQKEERLDIVERQLDLNSESLIRTHEVVDALSDDMKQLREDYGVILRKTFREHLNHSSLAFLLSSENFNQLSQRFFYIKQLDKYRKYQVALIVATQNNLKNKINKIEQKIEQKEQVFATIQEQKEDLDKKLNVTQEKLQSIQKSEKRLKTDLKKQQRQAERLDNIIQRIIKEEIENRQRLMREAAESVANYRKKNNNTASINSNDSKSRKNDNHLEKSKISRTIEPEIKETPESKELSDNFRNNKGNLPWPVRKGYISKDFGRQEHPELKGIYTINNGIDITTEPSSEVLSVAKGKVVAIQFIVGSDYLMIVQHGSYYAVYSNLDRTYVSKGDNITFRQTIGRSSKGKVHFEIWSNNSRENPKQWLAKN